MRMTSDFAVKSALIVCGFCLVMVGQEVMAQQAAPVEPAATVKIPVPADAFNRGTPRGSISAYIKAANDFDFDTAKEFLDLRNLPDDVTAIGGHELARQLNHVLSRAVFLDNYTVSDSPEGAKGDDLPDYRDEITRIVTADGEVPLWMQHVPRGDGVMIWKLSNRSVARIPALYDEFSFPEWVENIRAWFPEKASFLGLEAFKWFIILVSALLAWPVFYVIARVLTRLFSSPENPTYRLVRKIFAGPLVALAILLLVGYLLGQLGMSLKAEAISEARTLQTAAIVWALWSITNLYKTHQQEKMIALGRPGAAKLMRPITTLIKIVTVLLGLVFWLGNLGVNISTLLAGLGIGGLALALALQKPLEDMMGALTLFSQAPIRVGDFCRYGDIRGIVEDIGLRTTRIRTLANTLVSIPNSRIAHVEIENYSARKKVHFKPVIRLRYGTSPAQISAVLDGIKNVLTSNKKVLDDPFRVRFTDFADDAILIKVHAYIDTDNVPEFLEISEELNLEIMKAVHAAGAAFALPEQSIYLEGKEAVTT